MVNVPNENREILLGLYRAGLVETVFHCRNPRHAAEGWVLKSGSWSPLYINLRPIGSSPELLAEVGAALHRLIAAECPAATLLLGVHMAGIPLAVAASLASLQGRPQTLPFAYTRPLPGGRSFRTPEEARRMLAHPAAGEDWGGHELIEGDLGSGAEVVIVDDMVTSFGSKLIAREILEHEVRRLRLDQVRCRDVVVILDREQGACVEAERSGMGLHSLVRLRSDALAWLEGVAPAAEIDLIRDYLADPAAFQTAQARQEVPRRVAAERSSPAR